MMVRLVPYYEVFVAITLSLDEAAAVSAVLEASPGDFDGVPNKLREELAKYLDRASRLQEKRGNT